HSAEHNMHIWIRGINIREKKNFRMVVQVSVEKTKLSNRFQFARGDHLRVRGRKQRPIEYVPIKVNQFFLDHGWSRNGSSLSNSHKGIFLLNQTILHLSLGTIELDQVLM